MLAPDPATRAKILPRTLLPSFRQIALLLSLVAVGHWACGESWWGVFKFIGCCFLVPYLVGTSLFCAELRWPKFFERLYRVFTNPSAIGTLATANLAYWFIFANGWERLLSFRPDWRGALFILIFGAASIIAVGPPHWVYSRFIKPWSIRTEHPVLGFLAIASIAIFYWGAWMTGLIIWTSRG